MRAGKRARHILVSGAVAGAMVAIGLSAATASGAVTSHKVQNKTIIFAEAPGANPNYILPYDGCNFFSVDNINQFQELMFRPLYWFGLGSSAAEVPSLSIGNPPAESAAGKTWTLTVKPWNFAAGGKVAGLNVKFFLNLYKADPADNCGYNPGYGIPDDLTNVTSAGQKVTLTFGVHTVQNKLWMLYNNLSQITPFPISWDTTAGHKCANGAYNAPATNAACVAVAHALQARAGHVNTYATSFWQNGDTGPWKLVKFDALGNASFVPNPKYSGPVKAQVAHFQEKAYASDAAEENDLGRNAIQLGFLDPTYLTCCASAPGHVGPQVPFLNSTYKLVSGTEWGFNYAALNFNDPEIKQLYIRQALAYGIDQTAILKSIDKGYGNNTWSPDPYNMTHSLGTTPADPYPTSATSWHTGLSLLEAHGWTMSSGNLFCTSPGTGAGECGAGIGNNAALKVTLIYLTTASCPSCAETFNAETTNWNSEGFQVVSSQGTFNNVVVGCVTGTFQICSWGGGWIYAPDYEPTGESLFATGGGFNIGNYTDPTMDADIHATDFGTANLTAFGAYAAQQLPVLYQPTAAGTGEVSKALKGLQPPNPLGDLMPEYDHY
jgi:peptide/nickel transport system substrate-binding protein